MRLLLDTQAFLWWLQDSPRLSRSARRAVTAPTAPVFVSAASIWELAIKLSIGKLRWKPKRDVTLEGSIVAAGFTELAVSALHASAVRDLPLHHADPFDRLLIAQALGEGLRIVTSDGVFAAYGVSCLDAEG